MKIFFRNKSISLSEILENKEVFESTSSTEKTVIQLIKDWYNVDNYLSFQTSGSTGIPKTIQVEKEKIRYSCEATFGFIDPENEIKNCLLCIPPNYIGGAMVVLRALMKKLDLTVIEPTGSPCKELKGEKYDLVSMIPLQFQQLKESDYSHFKNIIVGGAPLFIQKTIKNTNVYSSFGMTETVSHFALRKLDENYFKTVGDAKIRTNKKNTLEISGSITNNQWLKTNDLIHLIDENTFEWVGRKDFIINSGGIKINPEKIEQILSDEIHGEFIISSLPDELLGERIILLTEKKQLKEINFSQLSKYEIPKQIIFASQLPKTKSGKVDRIKARELAQQINKNEKS